MQMDPDTRSLEGSESIHFAGFALDATGCTLTAVNGQDVPLRRAEFALLLAFLRSPGRVLSRDHLLDAVAGRPSAPYDRSIDVLVSRLRRKIEADPGAPRLILTMPGLGYKFAARPQRVRVSPHDRPHVGIDLLTSCLDKPSVAVLPFRNLSGDRDQDSFADGVTEEIITALSRIPSFSVIGRRAAFASKKAADTRQVGRKLGLRYALDGSVRKVGDRVRICAQLIDATSGAHLWTDRFDHALADSLDVQDEVTRSVVGAIDAKLRQVEIERSLRRPGGALRASDLVRRSQFTQERFYRAGLEESRRLLQRAVELDPNYALARALLAGCNFLMTTQLLSVPSESEMAGYVQMARGAVEDARDDPEVLIPAAFIIGQAADLDEGLGLLDRALNLNPNSTDGWAISGHAHAHEGDVATALNHLERSTGLNPLRRQVPAQSYGFVIANIMAGRYEQALTWSERASRDIPTNYTNLRTRSALLGLLGRREEARQALSQLFTIVPGLTVSRVRHQIEVVQRTTVPFKKTEYHSAIFEGLRMAGLPA
jgi:adenylate cyclase